MKVEWLCLEKHFTQYFISIKTLQFYKIYKQDAEEYECKS